VETVARIVRAMKEFSHPGTAEKKPVDLNRAIESVVTISRNEWKYVAELKTEFASDLPLVQCLPGEINQVVLNLIVNAAHAIAERASSTEGGLIVITTQHSGDIVELRVSDNGTGISEATRPKIFDPFFTTKEVRKGTGQGLAIAHDVIVHKHGGTISVETEMGKGTTFLVRLPVGEQQAL
jgi:two-component system NtrC family sensor kinase